MVLVQHALIEDAPGRVVAATTALLDEIGDDLAGLVALGVAPGVVELLPVDDTPSHAVASLRDALVRRGSNVRCARPWLVDAAPRAVITRGPRGRVVGLLLGPALGARTPTELRRTLRAVRRALLRQDALVIAGAAPRPATLAATRALELDHLVSMSAAAGFQLVGQWWAPAGGSTAIALLSAD
ncbi:hypothetical protein L6R52_07840 [Myxococcota bacterium]|nr:hypothetical protein [Myxococcota bacterium]